jgi:hypothetical protein
VTPALPGHDPQQQGVIGCEDLLWRKPDLGASLSIACHRDRSSAS